MTRAFSEYPSIWGLRRPDPNIDHRRVPNLMTFFRRHGVPRAITDDGQDFRPGNIVAWDLGGGLTHIGIVSDAWSEDRRRRLIIHNVGAGPKEEDALFRWQVIGNFVFRPAGK